MKLPVIDEKEVIPVRLIPLITHGELGRKTIVDVLAHELKVYESTYESRQQEHEAVVAEMKAVRAGMKPGNDITPLADILSGGGEEEAGDILNWLEPYAYRLNDEGHLERIPVQEWRIVGLEIRPFIELARRKEDKIGVEGAYRHEWHAETLKCIPGDAFMWREDLEKMFPSDKINYNAWIKEEFLPAVQEVLDRLDASIKKTKAVNKESTRTIETLQKMLTAIAIDAYHYIPGNKQNGDAMKDLQTAFATAGLDISDNTIRTHLKSGANLLDRSTRERQTDMSMEPPFAKRATNNLNTT